MIEGISGIPRVSEESLFVEKSKDALGRDDFLKMFLAQMNHQDPLNPMDSTEFSAQLAQFSSLEQLFNVNENLESIQAIQNDSSRFQALDFIGKEIVAKGDMLFLEHGKTACGGFTLDTEATCTVLISDSMGNPVKSMELGKLGAGQHSFEWDGLNNSGTDQAGGLYKFEIMAVTDSGQPLFVETQITGLVTRVGLEGNTSTLYVGEIPVAISQVMDIKAPEDSQGGEGGDDSNPEDPAEGEV